MPNVHVSGEDGSARDRDEVLARVCLGLANRRVTDDGAGGFAYARQVSGELVEVLQLPGADSVSYLRDGDVERLGLDALRAAGLENLLRAPLGREKVIEWPYGLKVHELWSPVSMHVAAKLLVFRDVLRRVLGTDEFPHGVLAIAPTVYELAFLPIEACQAFGALPPLAAYAGEAFSDDPAGLTPEVFWWRDGVLRPVLADDGEGFVEGFQDTMLRVAAEEMERDLGVTP